MWVATIGFTSSPAASYCRVEDDWGILAHSTTFSSSSTGMFFIFKIVSYKAYHIFPILKIYIFFSVFLMFLMWKYCTFDMVKFLSCCRFSKKLLLRWLHCCAFHIQCYLIMQSRSQIGSHRLESDTEAPFNLQAFVSIVIWISFQYSKKFEDFTWESRFLDKLVELETLGLNGHVVAAERSFVVSAPFR